VSRADLGGGARRFCGGVGLLQLGRSLVLSDKGLAATDHVVPQVPLLDASAVKCRRCTRWIGRCTCQELP
jgi:hypothetical protein